MNFECWLGKTLFEGLKKIKNLEVWRFMDG